MGVSLLPPGALQVERLEGGRRQLLRDLRLRIGRETVEIPASFVTDYSSWPRWLPGPRFDKIDIAGVVHDYLFKFGKLGVGGRAVSYVEANRIWYEVARSGANHVSRTVGWIGRIGLFVGSWPVWWVYRSTDEGD